jgi:hypothetical protein
MATVLTLLFLVVLALLVVGLVAPKKLARKLSKKSQKDITRKHFGLSFGAIAIVLLVLIGVTSPKTAQNQSIQLTTSKSLQTTPNPSITQQTVTQTKAVPFTSTTVQDANVAQGTTKVTTAGVNGVETLTYQDTYTNGNQIAQKQMSDVVTTQPVAQVTSVGTYVAPAPAPTSAATPTTTTSCTPLSASGNCYKPGEYCSDADHGMSGVAGDGKSITCEDYDGWRWEP